jgi:hypothetical protein
MVSQRQASSFACCLAAGSTSKECWSPLEFANLSVTISIFNMRRNRSPWCKSFQIEGPRAGVPADPCVLTCAAHLLMLDI